jgi:hypothetical protein
MPVDDRDIWERCTMVKDAVVSLHPSSGRGDFKPKDVIIEHS